MLAINPAPHYVYHHTLRLNTPKVCRCCDSVILDVKPGAKQCQYGLVHFDCACGSSLAVEMGQVEGE